MPTNAFIVDPENYDKLTAYKAATGYVREFLVENGLPGPRAVLHVAGNRWPKNKWRDYGWYKFHTMEMFVNLKKSRTPVKTPGFSWTYTGYKADLTGPGILAHETGHHVHNILERRHDRKELLVAIAVVRESESRVSSYEPNLHETFAEMMRLFILNPVMLREGRPLRYDFLTRAMGLKPLHDVSWKKVLKHAHPKLIAAAQNWIDQ